MKKNIFIDATHQEEVRVAVVNESGYLERYESETQNKTQVKGNIYLARVTRIEPSLQAAFVEYSNGKNGFLSFSEINPDYCQIPVNDKEEFDLHMKNATLQFTDNDDIDEEQYDQMLAKLRYQFYKRYKIQEVIKRKQVLLVQVVREERGNKGAALTTYLSLAGRYCVLMPNTSRNDGISKKISNYEERQKIKKILSSLPVPSGMSLVIRTAGIGHTKAEIKKDFEFLMSTWDEIRSTTLISSAPFLIYEEANIVKRAIRDIYAKDVEEVLIEGEPAYKIAKDFMKKISPKDSKNVKFYNEKISLFAHQNINSQIENMYYPRVELPSGGYLIINPTEALVSIDVNSGKSIRERNISEMAYKTNLEAATEIARQCQLRDLAGLIVVDFIDMTDGRSKNQVEKCLKDALKNDKAKIQVSGISQLGLLEFSRQRLRPSILEKSTKICPCCGGTGSILSIEVLSIKVFRNIEEILLNYDCERINITASSDIVMYILNYKKDFLCEFEKKHNIKMFLSIDSVMPSSDFNIDPVLAKSGEDDEKSKLEINKTNVANGESNLSDNKEVEKEQKEVRDAKEAKDIESPGSKSRLNQTANIENKKSALVGNNFSAKNIPSSNLQKDDSQDRNDQNLKNNNQNKKDNYQKNNRQNLKNNNIPPADLGNENIVDFPNKLLSFENLVVYNNDEFKKSGKKLKFNNEIANAKIDENFNQNEYINIAEFDVVKNDDVNGNRNDGVNDVKNNIKAKVDEKEIGNGGGKLGKESDDFEKDENSIDISQIVDYKFQKSLDMISDNINKIIDNRNILERIKGDKISQDISEDILKTGFLKRKKIENTNSKTKGKKNYDLFLKDGLLDDSYFPMTTSVVDKLASTINSKIINSLNSSKFRKPIFGGEEVVDGKVVVPEVVVETVKDLKEATNIIDEDIEKDFEVEKISEILKDEERSDGKFDERLGDNDKINADEIDSDEKGDLENAIDDSKKKLSWWRR